MYPNHYKNRRCKLRQQQRELLVKKYYKKFMWIHRINIHLPLDWHNYLHLPEIQYILKIVRDKLPYHPNTDDYTIWLTLTKAYKKLEKINYGRSKHNIL